ncbi:hypothetical protein IW261DRAFT_1574794 [Armillaria novae-zelandiae]|uniref:Uncharacterized protein n=1 Tax=Armillaria novae-zelandiae TaxID=153914 RepID=A0AA39T5F0_9AGAR|nr:hypothetical protein IW261DRAFT_1574794 [Armillaria novae-zelandiae]
MRDKREETQTSEEVEEKKSDDVDDDNVGVVNETYFYARYVVLLRVVARFHNEVSNDDNRQSSLKTVDFQDVTVGYDRELEAFKEEWDLRCKAIRGDREVEFRSSLSPFLVAWSCFHLDTSKDSTEAYRRMMS